MKIVDPVYSIPIKFYNKPPPVPTSARPRKKKMLYSQEDSNTDDSRYDIPAMKRSSSDALIMNSASSITNEEKYSIKKNKKVIHLNIYYFIFSQN